jgi:hypothetical protein
MEKLKIPGYLLMVLIVQIESRRLLVQTWWNLKTGANYFKKIQKSAFRQASLFFFFFLRLKPLHICSSVPSGNSI